MNKGEKAKHEILTAAVHLLLELGDTEKLTIRNIAEKTCILPSNIKYYFPKRTNLLNGLAEFVLAHAQTAVLEAYLANNREQLEKRESQIFFIDNLFHCFREFFLGTPDLSLCCDKALRLLLRSNEIKPGTLSGASRPYERDTLAFYEIYKTITGNDDADRASILYSTLLFPLAKRFAEPRPVQKLYSENELSPDFDLKFLYFCREQLMMELGLRRVQKSQAGKNPL